MSPPRVVPLGVLVPGARCCRCQPGGQRAEPLDGDIVGEGGVADRIAVTAHFGPGGEFEKFERSTCDL